MSQKENMTQLNLIENLPYTEVGFEFEEIRGKSLDGKEYITFKHTLGDFMIIANISGVELCGRSPVFNSTEKLRTFAKLMADAWINHRYLLGKVMHSIVEAK